MTNENVDLGAVLIRLLRPSNMKSPPSDEHLRAVEGYLEEANSCADSNEMWNRHRKHHIEDVLTKVKANLQTCLDAIDLYERAVATLEPEIEKKTEISQELSHFVQAVERKIYVIKEYAENFQEQVPHLEKLADMSMGQYRAHVISELENSHKILKIAYEKNMLAYEASMRRFEDTIQLIRKCAPEVESNIIPADVKFRFLTLGKTE